MIFFVARPLLKGAAGGAQPAPMLTAGAGPSALPAPTASLAYEASGESLALPGPDVEQTLEIARIEGQVKASSVKKVSEFVERHPEQSVSTIRNWLLEPAPTSAA
jgi:flagellar M-ring protein FliF